MGLSFVLFLDLDPTDTSPLVSQLTPAWVSDCADDVTTQLQVDAAPFWNDATTAKVRFGAGPRDIGIGEVAFAVVSTLANAPGAEAYHDVNGNAVPIAFLALDTCNTLADVSTGISHECLETVGDPECNLWADDGQGCSFAYELCDAVQASAYQGAKGNALSDFVIPAFFAPNSTGPYRFLATKGAADLDGPLVTQVGGYQLVRLQGAGETQISGSTSKLAKAKAKRSRMSRRGLRAPTAKK